MRHFLTFVAVLLVLALTAALVAPLFIDWSRHRGQIEAELSAVVGAPVVVAGPIDIHFLPTPYLLLQDVTIAGAPGGSPTLVCKSVQLEAALASLTSGRARFTLARLDHPTLALSRHPDGAIALPAWRPEIGGGRVALDRLVVDSGRVIVTGAGKPLDLALDLDASAASLTGPFRGTARVAQSDFGAAAIEFAGGEMADGSLPLKLEATRDDGPNLAFDGALKIDARADGVALAYIGAATASGVVAGDAAAPALPWRASTTLVGDVDRASAENLVLRVGPEERALEARGSARLVGGQTPRLKVDLAAKQLDFDALLRTKDQDSAPPARALAALARLVAPLHPGDRWPLAVDAKFAAPTVIVGAQTLSDVNLNASAAAGAPLTGDLSVNLPGDASLQFAGAIELGAAADFKGTMQIRLGDIAQLRDWATRGEPDWANRLESLTGALPYHSAAANGDVQVSSVGFSARNLNLTLDRSTLVGAIAYTAPVANDPARFFMDLRSDALDIDSLPDLNLSAGLIGGADLSLTLEAAKLRVGRPSDAGFEGGSLALKLTKTGGDIALDRFSLSGLGGASVEASGALGANGRWVKVGVDAEKLDDVAALVGRVAPGAASRWFAARAQALSPAKATLNAWSADPNTPGLDSIKADGAAGATQFSFTAKRSGDAADVNFNLDAADGSALMRQLGVAAAPGSTPRAHLEGAAKGRWDLGFDVQASGALSGADFTWRGRLRPTATEQDAGLFGAATLKSGDVSGLLAALGLGKTGVAVATPVDLAGDVSLRGAQFALPRLTGVIAGSKVDGKLTWRPAAAEAVDPDVALAQSIAGETPQANGGVTGDLSVDRVGLASLAGPLLGASRALGAAFAPPPLDPPPLDLNLKIGALDMGFGAPARSAAARLRIDRGRLDVDDATMTINGARASGRLTLRRDSSLAAATGQVAIEPVAVDQAALRGRIGGEFSFAGSGDSLAALIGGLAGDGKIEWRGASAPHLDPGALTRELAKTQSGDAPIDETNVGYALGGELDRAALPLPDGGAPATLSAGVIRLGPLNIPRAGGSATASAAFDLRAGSLALDVAFAEARGGKFWNGPPPAVDVSVKGPLDAPTRRIDAAPLAAGLAAQAIARETDRISALEADIRERAYFNRRLKAQRYMRQREAELAAFAAEQSRLKAEADRKQAEEDRKKAEDESRKKAEDDAKRAQDEAKRAQDAAANAQPPLPPLINAIQPIAPQPPSPTPTSPAPRAKVEPTDPTATGLY